MKTDTINGWTPPLIYDAGIDARRIATQADIDTILQQLNILGSLYGDVKKAVESAALQMPRKTAQSYTFKVGDYVRWPGDRETLGKIVEMAAAGEGEIALVESPMKRLWFKTAELRAEMDHAS